MTATLAERLRAGDAVLAPNPGRPVRREVATVIASALARAALAVLDDLGILVATGGGTARSILTAAGVTQLQVVGGWQPSAGILHLGDRGSVGADLIRGRPAAP
jgi:uncharacterized protein YgbK (DUF1537 family)